MPSYTVISNESYIPKALSKFEVDLYSMDAFLYESATNDVVNVNDFLYVHADCLTQDIYDALCQCIDLNLVIYRYESEPLCKVWLHSERGADAVKIYPDDDKVYKDFDNITTEYTIYKIAKFIKNKTNEIL